jgi:hypothetical protein
MKFKIYDKFGFERTLGTIVKDDKIVVTAGNKSTTYYLTILDETANYLAYILSDTYAVDQLGFTVLVVATEEPLVSQFTSNITPAPDATFAIKDAQGAAKGTDVAMADGDIVSVTAGNGVVTIDYTVDLDIQVGVDNDNASSISVYPNPTQGRLNISGLTPGNRIQVYNIAGIQVQNRMVYQEREIISLENQPNGIYFLVVSDSENVIGRYKLVRE